jgi:hypothetical protein
MGIVFLSELSFIEVSITQFVVNFQNPALVNV